ncbi:SLAP domain-containing protein [Lentibacillus sp. N15]|uniref:SLAP domain-containing protein n=1 Tax=Lentibacillus songyuanensis TaxID=3136161 RepID=UPI0031BACE7D
MQKLTYESAWDKTISAGDRDKIEQAFYETYLWPAKKLHFTVLWRAKNYKDALLVTVLIHNFSSHPVSFHQKSIRYIENNIPVSMHTFSLPTPIIEGQTSMPWTFIFPVGNYNKQVSVKNCYIVEME